MLFPTVEFALFLLPVLAATWLVGARNAPRKAILLVASYAFLACWGWEAAALLLLSSLICYGCARAIDGAGDPTRRRNWLTLGLVAHLGTLAALKYAGFVATTLDGLCRSLGLPLTVPAPELTAPIGLSFYTFIQIGYLLDVAQGHVRASRSLLDVLLLAGFFPQTASGPINRSGTFLPQLERTPEVAREDVGRALALIAGGLAKKTLIAHYVGVLLVEPVFANPLQHTGLEALFGVYGYAVQVYCDFSAYTDIAIGVALLLGYRLPENFRQPYRAASVQEFWRRWHISLSSWLEAYLFLPFTRRLVRSRLRKRRMLTATIGTMVTFLLCGLWHGAAWTFVLWGAWHGLGVTLDRVRRKGEHPPSALRRAGSTAWTFHWVCAGWVLFRCASLPEAGSYLSALAHWGPPAPLLTPVAVGLVALGLALHFVPESATERLIRSYSALPSLAQGVLFGAAVALIASVGPEGVAPFLYFRF